MISDASTSPSPGGGRVAVRRVAVVRRLLVRQRAAAVRATAVSAAAAAVSAAAARRGAGREPWASSASASICSNTAGGCGAIFPPKRAGCDRAGDQGGRGHAFRPGPFRRRRRARRRAAVSRSAGARARARYLLATADLGHRRTTTAC